LPAVPASPPQTSLAAAAAAAGEALETQTVTFDWDAADPVDSGRS